MRTLLAACVVAAVLAGCGSKPTAQQPTLTATPTQVIPSTVSGTVPVPTNTLPTNEPTDAAVPPQVPEQATAPPPANAGPLTSHNLPAPEQLGAGWKTYTDPGGAEAGFIGNNSWTRRRDPHQASYEALPSGCSGQQARDSLPVPAYALTGSYRTADALPATALLLRFSTPARAAAYYRGYENRMTDCGTGGDLSVQQLWATTAAATAVRSYTGAESYVDVSVLKGATVALLATTSAAPAQQANWAHTAAAALESVID